MKTGEQEYDNTINSPVFCEKKRTFPTKKWLWQIYLFPATEYIHRYSQSENNAQREPS